MANYETEQIGDTTYRPISPLAVVGLVCACLFVGLVLLTSAMALIQGMPFFLKGWAIAIAVAGVVFSLVGMWHIASSEGTRAGMALARWGLWLSIFTGSGYFAYDFFTDLALRQQANAFLMEKGEDSGFFPRLREGKTDPVELRIAFLMTRPYADRAGHNPAEETRFAALFDKFGPEGPAPFTMFREQMPVREIIFWGQEGKIEPLGTQSCTYKEGGYRVTRNYRVTTPDMTYEMPVEVASSDGPDGRRKWFVSNPKFSPRSENFRLTKRGETAMRLRSLARSFADTWSAKVALGEPVPEFSKLDLTNWGQILENMGKEMPKDRIRDTLTNLFVRPAKDKVHLRLGSPDNIPPYDELKDKTIRVTLSFNLILNSPALAPVPLSVEGRLYVDSVSPFDLQSEAKMPDWRVSGIEFLRVATQAKGP